METIKRFSSRVLKFIRSKWWLWLILAGIGGYLWYRSANSHLELDESRFHTVSRNTIRETLSLPGEIDAEERVNLKFSTPGRLAWVGVEEGDTVAQYQGIATLDQRELEKRLEKQLNTFLKTRYTFDQSIDDNDTYTEQPTRKEGDTMKRLIDLAQLDLDNSVLEVELQTIAKEEALLYSPIAGKVVKAFHPYPGVQVSTSQVEFEVINPSTIYFSATSDQAEVVKLAEGMTGEITFDAFVEEQIPGTIEAISFTPIEGEIGTVYEVKMSVISPRMDSYRMGMTGDVTFVIREKEDTLSIPSEYVQFGSDDEVYVMKKTEEGLEKTPVEMGEELEGEIEILSGLVEGDVIYEEES